MQLQNELKKLTKQELIYLIINKGMFLRTEKRDITLIRIETLSMKAETDGQKALDDMDKYSSKNHLKWCKALKDHGKAMKIYDKIDALYESMKKEEQEND